MEVMRPPPPPLPSHKKISKDETDPNNCISVEREFNDNFKYCKNILVLRLHQQFLRTDFVKAPQWLQKKISNFKKYEHIIQTFGARDLEISNTYQAFYSLKHCNLLETRSFLMRKLNQPTSCLMLQFKGKNTL